MNVRKSLVSTMVTLALCSVANAVVLPESQKTNPWFQQADSEIKQKRQQTTSTKAKNVILFVGDGMGISTQTAARILEGQLAGFLGEEQQLSFEKFPYSALVKTYNVDAQTPDSAGTMTAMMSGVKTDAGIIGLSEEVQRGECVPYNNKPLASIIDLAEIKGLATGIVTTARITHATPAATYAQSPERNWEDISDMPEEAIAAGCKDIADQLVNYQSNLENRYVGIDTDGIEVMFGGGRRHFLPKDAAFNSPDASSEKEGDRSDARDLISEWQNIYTEGVYVYESTGFNNIDTENTTQVLGLFNESHMQYEADRGNDISGEPSLSEMTSTAINILDNNDQGYFLMVESGRIDHAHHAGSAAGALTDTIELNAAVKQAIALTNPEETLIIVTADHSHVFTIAGYPKRGNPILGKVVSTGRDTPTLAKDDQPYTTLGYSNGRGFRDLGTETNADATYDSDAVAGRVDLTAVDTESHGFHQETTVPRSSETHAGEDVALYAQGPGAHLAQGNIEQNVVFHMINNALDLVGQE